MDASIRHGFGTGYAKPELHKLTAETISDAIAT